MRPYPVVFHPALDRAIALLVFATAAVCVYVLAQVTPDARGHGTHGQLGMLPCSWPATLNAPCPTCGATTAACHIVHLSPFLAIATQPFGAAVALAGIAMGVWGLVAVVSGRNFLGGLARLPAVHRDQRLWRTRPTRRRRLCLPP